LWILNALFLVVAEKAKVGRQQNLIAFRENQYEHKFCQLLKQEKLGFFIKNL